MYDLKEMKYMNIVHKRWLQMLLGNKDLVPHNPRPQSEGDTEMDI